MPALCQRRHYAARERAPMLRYMSEHARAVTRCRAARRARVPHGHIDEDSARYRCAALLTKSAADAMIAARFGY